MREVDILFIIPPFHMRNGGGSFFPLGISYIISSLKRAGYSWEIVNCTEIISSYYEDDLSTLESELSKRLRGYSPSVVGIGPCITTQLKAIHRISVVCNKIFPRIPILAGGPFASIEGQEWVFFDFFKIDFLVKGDGEEAILDILYTIKKNRDIRSSNCISYEKRSCVNVVSDLDSLDFPYREFAKTNTYSMRRKATSGKQAPMIASRGCPYACNYCVSGNMKKNHVPFRKRSYENIVAEMSYLINEYGIDDVIFYDDCFFSNREKINSEVDLFCSLLLNSKIKMKWQIEMRPDYLILLSPDAMNQLTKAGCRQINIGIEKISKNGLRFLGKDGNWAGLKEKVVAVKNAGITVTATFILGGEGETEDDVKKIIYYAKDLSLEFAHFNPLFVYPGTPLYSKVFSDNKAWVDIILNDELPWGEIVYENEHLNRDRLLRLIDYAYMEFYKDTPYEHEQMVEDRFNIKVK